MHIDPNIQHSDQNKLVLQVAASLLHSFNKDIMQRHQLHQNKEVVFLDRKLGVEISYSKMIR